MAWFPKKVGWHNIALVCPGSIDIRQCIIVKAIVIPMHEIETHATIGSVYGAAMMGSDTEKTFDGMCERLPSPMKQPY
jgi:hypothetical protein